MDYKFKGVCPVINVPFFENGEIDFKGIDNEVEFALKEGCTAISVFAFNSEPHKMSLSEKKQVIEYFLKSVNNRMETLVGLIENSVKDVTDLGLTAKKFGADGVILYPPALSTPAGKKLIEYFKTIADAVDLPVMIQDNPRSTGVTMSLDLLLDAYKEIEKFDYLKVECPIPVRKMKDIVNMTDGKLKCYSGNGGIFAVDAFLSGAWGIMPGVSICGKFVKLCKALEDGKIEEARTWFEKILPFTWFEDQSMEFYIACEKAILKEIGVIDCDYVREPATNITEAERKELLTLYNRL